MTDDKGFFTVGELSSITGVSKQAIRYYDRVGLLKPVSVDAQNSYRYYEPIHVLYLNSITRLSQLGCSLAEIKKYIFGGDLEATMKMLAVRRDLTQRKIAELKSAQSTLEKQISIIEEGLLAKDITDVVIKRCPERRFIYIENNIKPGIKQAILQISDMVKKMEERGALFVCSPVFEYIHTPKSLSTFRVPRDHRILKTGFFYDEKQDAGLFSADIVPEGNYACVIHRGKYDDMASSVEKLYDYLEENSLRAMSNVFQLYTVDYALTQNENELLTELQILVEKKV
jgi:DNA-binding transcriptional MerR regulator